MATRRRRAENGYVGQLGFRMSSRLRRVQSPASARRLSREPREIEDSWNNVDRPRGAAAVYHGIASPNGLWANCLLVAGSLLGLRGFFFLLMAAKLPCEMYYGFFVLQNRIF